MKKRPVSVSGSSNIYLILKKITGHGNSNRFGICKPGEFYISQVSIFKKQ